MDEKPIVIAVLAGTIREGRRSFAAARFVAEEGKKRAGVEIIMVDPRQLKLPGDGNKTPETHDPSYTGIVGSADAFFIVTPEYNHSFPGSLKRMLDSEYDQYAYKPVALAGASDGPWGGARAVESLLPVLRTLRMITCSNSVYFPFVQNVFDEHDQMRPESQEQYTKSVTGAYEELVWLARVLRYGRQSIPRS